MEVIKKYPLHWLLTGMQGKEFPFHVEKPIALLYNTDSKNSICF